MFLRSKSFFKTLYRIRIIIHAVVTIVEKIIHALDCGKIVGGVFIDFKKAYDTVSHDILLRKLEAYGIKIICINYLRVIYPTENNLSNTRMENQM